MKRLGKTVGYIVQGFHKLKHPVDRGNLKPLIYAGTVYFPWQDKSQVIQWDEDGKCANTFRTDCFINTSEFLKG